MIQDIRKRLIAINLHAPPLPTTATNSKNQISTTILPLNQEAGLRMLIEHLDTVYSDPDGWLQLSQVYCSMKLYV